MPTDIAGTVAAGAWGLAVGLLNNRLVAAPLARLRAGVRPDSPEGRALARTVARRFLLRVPVDFLALGVVFLLRPEPAALVATALGIVAASALLVAAAARERGKPGA